MAYNYEELIKRMRLARGSMSQAELAKKSGVSNKTISEYERGIYDKGGKPRLETLARMAVALGDDPVEWAKLAGLPFNSAKVDKAKLAVTIRSEMRDSQRLLIGSSLNSLEEIRTASVPIIRVGVITRTTYESFDKEHIRLLCSLINYRWQCNFRSFETVGEQNKSLYDIHNRCHVITGVLETMERISSGLAFIPYPGFQYSINAVVGFNESVQVDWTDVRLQRKDILAVAIEGEAGDQYLRAVCGYSDTTGNIYTIKNYLLEEILNVIHAVASNNPHRPVIFCGVEDVCVSLVRAVRNSKARLAVPPLNRQKLFLPRYKPGLAVRYEDREWTTILSKAQELAMVIAPDRMAKLYADLLIPLIPLDKPFDHGYSFGRLYDLGVHEINDFLECLREELIGGLKERAFRPPEYKQIVDYIMANTLQAKQEKPNLQNLTKRIDQIEYLLNEIAESLRKLKKN